MQRALLVLLLLLLGYTSQAQIINPNPSDTTAFKPSGNLWGLAFGDYYYKAHTDALNRGGANQYTGIEKGRNAFQFRRIYLGYNYEISRKFAAELLLAAEDNVVNQNGVVTGDLLGNNKLGLYIKLANLRWKNVWRGTDLLVGQVPTPAFSFVSDPIWGYRSIERTITDIRRTPSFDMGVELQGRYKTEATAYGYNVMIGNGTSARPENDKYKKFSGDVFAKFMDQKLVVDLYADYQRLNWTSSFHHSSNMVKGFVGYVTPAVTVGVEAFLNHGKNDVIGIRESGAADTLSANAMGISTFIKGTVIKDKLGYFARIDNYNPDENYDATQYVRDEGLSGNYEPNNKEQLILLGLDYTPAKNVHFMPNIWYNKYKSQRSDVTDAARKDYDLAYRLTFYYVFGK